MNEETLDKGGGGLSPDYYVNPVTWLFYFCYVYISRALVLRNLIFLYNSFYFNQHMHYNFVVIYTPTYVSTTY
jgi:hypothetical protein